MGSLGEIARRVITGDLLARGETPPSDWEPVHRTSPGPTTRTYFIPDIEDEVLNRIHDLERPLEEIFQKINAEHAENLDRFDKQFEADKERREKYEQNLMERLAAALPHDVINALLTGKTS